MSTAELERSSDDPPSFGPDDARVRPMRAEDVEMVLEIETRQFTTPWQADTFHGLIDRPGAELWVIEHPHVGVIAYCVLWLLLDHGELANIAVRPAFGGRGFAHRLLELMFGLARERGVANIFLEVRASNERAIEIYRSFGFEEMGRRKAYYDKPTEDALVMRMEL